MQDEFDTGPIAPRPARPVAKDAAQPPFTLGTDWQNHTGGDSSGAGAGDGISGGSVDNGFDGMETPTLTKAEAIQLAKLIVLYPFLSKVL